MPAYDRGDPPQKVEDVLRFLREELQRIEAYTRAPRTTGAWDDLRFPAQALAPGAASPGWNTTDIGYSFGSVATNSVQGVGQMPHAWREGTNIRPHIHWEATTGFTAGTAVVWVLSYRWRNNGETAGAMTAYTVTVTPSHTLALMITPLYDTTTDGVDGTGKEISSIFEFNLSRTPTATGDNMDNGVLLKEFDIHYRADAFGSDKEYVK